MSSTRAPWVVLITCFIIVGFLLRKIHLIKNYTLKFAVVMLKYLVLSLKFDFIVLSEVPPTWIIVNSFSMKALDYYQKVV